MNDEYQDIIKMYNYFMNLPDSENIVINDNQTNYPNEEYDSFLFMQ